MEKLKSVVPSNIMRMISESTADDLPSTCSSLLDFFLSLQLFHDVVRELTDPELGLCRKDAGAALDFKKKGNECFASGDYAKALSFYSQALRSAPMDKGDETDKNLVPTLYVNRASTLHKMGLTVESVRDCNRAVVRLPSYTKAWYRRGMANASMGNYEDAIQDLDIAMNMELSSGGNSKIKEELEIIKKQSRRVKNSPKKASNMNCSSIERFQTKLKCVSTSTKGRGIVSTVDVSQASLIHFEEPYAVIITKACRKTHCHFCLNELPADTVPCSSCSMTLYCSQYCQEQAIGQKPGIDLNVIPALGNVSTDLKRYVERISLENNSGHPVADSNPTWVAEHRHECGGVHWPAVLPAEIVLAGRVLVKKIEAKKYSKGDVDSPKALELCHNYGCMTPETKLEIHIYAIVLTYCLQLSYADEVSLSGLSQLAVLISQIKVNSMAVVHMKSPDACEQGKHSGGLSPMDNTLTNQIEQVRVGQAIYSTGSLFNHSCQPNVHAYFLSRSLLIRSTEFVEAGYPLEISYGPQVGQGDLKDRQKVLEDQYSFRCQCSGCSELNLSDIVINALACVKPSCFGAVVDRSMVNGKRQGANWIQDVSTISCLEQPLPIDKQKRDDVSEVAHLLFEHKDGLETDLGYCLNCRSYRDLESSQKAIRQAEINIKRLQSRVTTGKLDRRIISDALGSLDILRLTMHAYNKYIAQVEDSFAEAFCSIGDFQSSVQHCKASIKILEKLYNPNHIVIGNELVKLASLQQCLGDNTSALDSINRLDAIFSLYYGSHAAKVVPYLNSLKREASKLLQLGDTASSSESN
ncbi:SET and MYND domain-containing protein 4-like isoform X2 [Papaver somniferum]|uniref:SET and MYND domain-containing protein 4-like isoform X2 n=1 Tax=Papaver somniferum TaxID=3469 RepID=UPI000E6F8EAA|nr:SET and MYND domain-containing protein 4-like isoform X2 [Papaver somniferum]